MPTASIPPRPPGATSGAPSETEFDRLTKDSRTQDFWFRRVVAYIIDSIIVIIVTAIIGGIALLILGIGAFFSYAAFGGAFFPFSATGAVFTGLSGLLFLLYFTLADFMYHRTIGKNIMGLEVATTDGSPLDIGKAFIRNVSKIYWLLLLLDLIGGFFMKVKPGQKFTDSIANTVIVANPRR